MQIEIKITAAAGKGKTTAARNIINQIIDLYNDVDFALAEEKGYCEVWHVAAGDRK